MKPFQQASDRTGGLSFLLYIANLLPPDIELPVFPDSNVVLSGRESLKKSVWEKEFVRFLDDSFPRTKFAEFRSVLDDGLGNEIFPAWEAYAFIKDSREALKMIASQQNLRSRFSLATTFPWQLISQWDIGRIRVCESCKKLFYAGRRNKLTCSASCSNTRRVREWRKHQDQYEQARKLKPVKPRLVTATATKVPKEKK